LIVIEIFYLNKKLELDKIIFSYQKDIKKNNSNLMYFEFFRNFIFKHDVKIIILKINRIILNNSYM